MMGLFQILLWALISSARQYCSATNNNNLNFELNDDVLGLIVFKSDIKDPYSNLHSWNEDDDDPCSWQFIKCNPANGRVSEVTLDGLGLSGKIGRGLEKLQHLKVLSLSRNNFTGNISPSFSLGTVLERLNLSHNGFSGVLPSSIVNLSSIKFLDLSDNSFSGPILDNVFENCLGLRFLSLAGNMFEGPITSTLSKCSSLNNINLSNNRFSGNLEFGKGVWLLKRIRVLDVSHNALSGSVPQGVLAIHDLKQLLFQGNQFSGPLPADIGFCPHLNKLDFSDNMFTGTLPGSLKMLQSLSFFSVSNNMLTGDFPQWVSTMSSLEYIDFSNNGLTGSLPSSMGDLRSLSYLSLCNNKITGNVPLSLGSSNKLSVIQLRGNSFEGSIPEGLLELGLEEIDFSHNRLTGPVPPGSTRLFESLQKLDLSRNNLTGDIPPKIGQLSNLRFLNLSMNNLQSRIPPELGYLQNLKVLDFRSSGLFGSIPGNICDSGSLSILQLDENSLTGPIPEEIGNCSALYLLDLSHNSLNNSIPESISKLNKLEILRLEMNELTGEIPLALGRLENLLAVNVSYNRLIGRLPIEGIFPSLGQSALQGNLGICSPLLKGPCKMNSPKPLVLNPHAYGNQMGDHGNRKGSSSSTKFGNHMFLSVSALIAISAAILIVVGVVIISLINVSFRRRLAFIDIALESMCSSSSRSAGPPTGKLILFGSRSSIDSISNPESLLHKAAEIGEGVFGTVYKIPVGARGRVIAIKKLVKSNVIQSPEDFDREVRILGKARHQNLIALKGYYWTPQVQLLVTEYAPNGSLQSQLHERLASSPPLSWANRFKIVLGTAKGLAHLHYCHPPIIHYNIKPSNILLDEDYNPKISDFGLARLLNKLDNHVMRNRFQSSLGYAAPELACKSLRVNEKCDIYGFGVLILELVTGRRPVEYGEDNMVILNDHVKVLLEQGNVLDCVDPSMTKYPEDEVLPILKLALICTSQIPSSRPSMSEVVQIMQLIKTPTPQIMEAF